MKKTLLFAFSALVFSHTALAKEEWAIQFGVHPDCSGCHASGDVNSSDNVMKANVFPEAKDAYNQDFRNLTKLEAYLKAKIGNTTVTGANTKPVLNKVNSQWDIEVGKTLSIPLSVDDKEEDVFALSYTSSPTFSGGTFSAVRTDSNTQLPTVDFQWTPTTLQANKSYKVTFTAKETNTTQKLSSNAVSVTVRVLPATTAQNTAVSKLVLSTATWNSTTQKITLTGKVTLNSSLTTQQKASFLAQKFDLTVRKGTTATGLVVGIPVALKLSSTGSWTATVSAPKASVPCSITAEYQGKTASRTVTRAPSTCKK